MLDVSRSDLTAAVAGAGTMGRGIAQVLAQGGVRTLLYDAQPGAAGRAIDSISQALARLAEKGRVKDPQSIMRRIEVVPGLQALAPCDVVVEAIIEDLAAKRTLFSELEEIVSERCILASNTSSLSVTASATRRCAARTRRASSSTTPAARSCPNRCVCSPKASPISPPSTASWSTPPASASAR